MRILHISTRLILGGSQENTVLSCEGQARRGHDVHLAFGPIHGPEGSLLERVRTFRTADGRAITTHAVPHLVRQASPVADVIASRELRRLISNLQPDTVHTHSSKAGVVGRIAAWNASPRPGIVHTIHGPPFMPIDGPPLRRARTRLNNWLYTRAERFAANRCHAIVSVADAMTRGFLARGIGRAEQYTTVRSGMETEPFLHPAPGQSRADIRAALGLSETDFVIGTVARLAEHKGHDDLLDALGEAMSRDPRVKLLWVGDGWWRERLMRRVRAMNLASSVLTTGLVAPERIPGLIRAMDVLAHPSYREGLPRTVPQALLAGVCPIAYDRDGTGEVCRDMQTGRLVPAGDRAALRDAILWARDHPTERAALAQRGRDECRTTFSAGHMVDELEKVYQHALQVARAEKNQVAHQTSTATDPGRGT